MRVKGECCAFLTLNGLAPKRSYTKEGSMGLLSFPARNRIGLYPAIWSAFFVFSCSALAQHDPGPDMRNARSSSNSPSTGDPLSGLTSGETAAFNNGKTTFQEVDSVSGTLTSGSGLGPRFNLDSCTGCHAFPAIGGSSPAVNPQIAMATTAGA